MKLEDLLDTIEKKLELNHDMIEVVLDKLRKEGSVTVGALRALKKESWDKLNLPLAVEEEIKSQVSNTQRNMYANWMMSAYPYWYAAQNTGAAYGYMGGYNQQNMYYPNGVPQQYEGQDSVLGEGEIEKKDKDETGNLSASDNRGAVGSISALEASNPENQSASLVALSMGGLQGLPTSTSITQLIEPKTERVEENPNHPTIG